MEPCPLEHHAERARAEIHARIGLTTVGLTIGLKPTLIEDMCKTCSVVGCRNVPPTAGISFHSFPKDPETRRLWLVALKRDRWEPKASSCACSAHFTKEDYEYDPGIALRMGMKPFSRLLK
ncbi:hypothetical protein HPB51_026709 [Rhipicephalus microplus]|uniref:THAP-type domain-containing protein n=1 Tax=Rhipicephalus microplus TaxID=6941 RepID=A0A9J6D1Z6_RHIMP|nr:hypothetical protein HPB51_026709 [Rhipicephalus microplus]